MAYRIIQRSDELMGIPPASQIAGIPPASQIAGMGQLRVPEGTAISGHCGESHCPTTRRARNTPMLGAVISPATRKLAKKLKKNLKQMRDQLVRNRAKQNRLVQKGSMLAQRETTMISNIQEVENSLRNIST